MCVDGTRVAATNASAIEHDPGRPPGAAHNDGPLYRIPLFASMSCSLVAPILGMAQGSLDEFVSGTKDRITRGAALS